MARPPVSSRPEILDGQPCFEGTRTPVDVLFVNLAAGERLDVVLASTPAITREAGLAPEARAAAGDVMYPGDWDVLAADERAEYYRRR